MKTLIFIFCCLLSPSLRGATRYAQEPQLQACLDWEKTEQALMDGAMSDKEARAKFIELWPLVAIDDMPSPKEGLWQWVFPLPGYGEGDYSAQSYVVNDFRFLDGPRQEGMPGFRIYARDLKRAGLDDRNRKPIPVVSATEGVVVSARKFWKEGDPNPFGVYVCVLSQDEKHFFYYMYMSKLRVSTGQLVAKGEVLGWLGRSGHEVASKRLGTQLRFQVHSFDAGLFYPVYPGRALRVAEALPWPLPDHVYTFKRLKRPKIPLSTGTPEP